MVPFARYRLESSEAWNRVWKVCRRCTSCDRAWEQRSADTGGSAGACTGILNP